MGTVTTMTDRRDPCKSCKKPCKSGNCEARRDWIQKAEKWLHSMTYDGLPKEMHHDVKK